MNLYEKIKRENVVIPPSFDLTVMQLFDLQDNVPDKYDKICSAFKFGYIQGQRALKVNRNKEVRNDQLLQLLSQLDSSDYAIKRQITAILYRYLEKRDRLPVNPERQYDRKQSIMETVDKIENQEYKDWKNSILDSATEKTKRFTERVLLLIEQCLMDEKEGK